MRSSNGYAAFVVGFAIMTDSMIYTLVLPFLPDLFTGRLHVPEHLVPRWTSLSFEAFAGATLLTNRQYPRKQHKDPAKQSYAVVVGSFANASTSKSRPFLISVLLMVMSTILFFVGTTPAMILGSRVIQGASVTFTWVTGLAFLVAQVGEGDLGTYVGWTTVGVAVGEIVGPVVGGPIYDYFGHWAAFGFVEALLLVDILLRVFAKEKKPGIDRGTEPEHDTESAVEQVSEADPLLHQSEQANATDYGTTEATAKETPSEISVAKRLAWDWLGTVFLLIIIFMVRGALEVAVPLYLTRQYSWTPTKISLLLLTLTAPAAINPVIGRYTSRHGPRWWSVGGFVVCGAAMISFATVAGPSRHSQILFVVHSIIVGIALALLINANQVAVSVASQRYGIATKRAKDGNEESGSVLSWINPSTMLSGVTTSWAAGILLGPAYSSLIAYSTDEGWAIFCRGLGGLCLGAATINLFIWRYW